MTCTVLHYVQQTTWVLHYVQQTTWLAKSYTMFNKLHEPYTMFNKLHDLHSITLHSTNYMTCTLTKQHLKSKQNTGPFQLQWFSVAILNTAWILSLNIQTLGIMHIFWFSFLFEIINVTVANCDSYFLLSIQLLIRSIFIHITLDLPIMYVSINRV